MKLRVKLRVKLSVGQRSGWSALPQRQQLAHEFRAGCWTEARVERLLVLGENATRTLVRRAAILSDGGSDRPPVVRVGHARHVPIRFQPIDELGDVGLSAAVALRELGERERLLRQDEMAKRAELRERQADIGEEALSARLHGARRVEQQERDRATGAGVLTIA